LGTLRLCITWQQYGNTEISKAPQADGPATEPPPPSSLCNAAPRLHKECLVWVQASGVRRPVRSCTVCRGRTPLYVNRGPPGRDYGGFKGCGGFGFGKARQGKARQGFGFGFDFCFGKALALALASTSASARQGRGAPQAGTPGQAGPAGQWCDTSEMAGWKGAAAQPVPLQPACMYIACSSYFSCSRSQTRCPLRPTLCRDNVRRNMPTKFSSGIVNAVHPSIQPAHSCITCSSSSSSNNSHGPCIQSLRQPMWGATGPGAGHRLLQQGCCCPPFMQPAHTCIAFSSSLSSSTSLTSDIVPHQGILEGTPPDTIQI
jgi:hypothetical protein